MAKDNTAFQVRYKPSQTNYQVTVVVPRDGGRLEAPSFCKRGRGGTQHSGVTALASVFRPSRCPAHEDSAGVIHTDTAHLTRFLLGHWWEWGAQKMPRVCLVL